MFFFPSSHKNIDLVRTIGFHVDGKAKIRGFIFVTQGTIRKTRRRL